jgi:hypothetical protein
MNDTMSPVKSRRSTREERVQAFEYASQLALLDKSDARDPAANAWIRGELQDGNYVNHHIGLSKAETQVDALFAERRELAVIYSRRLAAGESKLSGVEQNEFNELFEGMQTLDGIRSMLGPWQIADLPEIGVKPRR